MSYEVYASDFEPPITKEVFNKLNKEFEHRHRIRHLKAIPKYRVISTHPHNLTELLETDKGPFFAVPCHWNMQHMFETADDIVWAAKRIGLTINNIRASSQGYSGPIPDKKDR